MDNLPFELHSADPVLDAQLHCGPCHCLSYDILVVKYIAQALQERNLPWPNDEDYLRKATDAMNAARDNSDFINTYVFNSLRRYYSAEAIAKHTYCPYCFHKAVLAGTYVALLMSFQQKGVDLDAVARDMPPLDGGDLSICIPEVFQFIADNFPAETGPDEHCPVIGKAGTD